MVFFAFNSKNGFRLAGVLSLPPKSSSNIKQCNIVRDEYSKIVKNN